MRPGPSAVAKLLIERGSLLDEPRPLRDLIAELCLDQGWAHTRADALERAEFWHDGTLNKLRRELNRLIEEGRPPALDLNSANETLVQGACFPEPKDSQSVRDMKRRRANSSGYYRAFDRLTPDDFERLCAKTIGLFGAITPTVTRRSADEGIDFYGQLSLGSIFFPHDLTDTIQQQLTVWLVGQAKHYQSGQAGTPELRDLAGAVTLARAGAFGGTVKPLEDVTFRVAEPVFTLFFTTGRISSNGWRLLRRSGIIGLDGEQLAAFLADRGAAITDPAGHFSEERFFSWLND